MGKKRNTAQRMYTLMEAYERSGKKQREFCREQGIRKSTFGYWLRKYRNKDVDAPGFVPLQISSPKGSLRDAGGNTLEIRYPGGIVIEFHELVPAAYLRTLLK